MTIDFSKFRSDTYRGDSRPQRWLVEGRLPAGKVVVVAGDGGAGKSFAMLETFVAINDSGSPWVFGGHVADRGAACLYLAGEDSREDIDNRLTTIRAHQNAKAAARGYILPTTEVDGGLMLFDYEFTGGPIKPTVVFEELDRLLAAMIAESGTLGIVVVDTLSVLCSPGELTNAEATAVMQGLSRIAVKYDACVVVLHHYKKPSGFSAKRDAHSVRGASAIVNSARLVYGLERLGDADAKAALNAVAATQGCAIRVEVLKANASVNRAPITLAWPDGGGMIDVSDLTRSGDAKTALVELVRAYNAKGVRVTKTGKTSLHAQRNETWPPALKVGRDALVERINSAVELGMLSVAEDGSLVAASEAVPA